MKIFLSVILSLVCLLLVYSVARPVLRRLVGNRLDKVLANAQAEDSDFESDATAYWESYELAQHQRLEANDPSVFATLREIRRRRALARSTISLLVTLLNSTPQDSATFAQIVEQLCFSVGRTSAS